MAQTRTALGTNSAKASGTTLTISGVSVPQGRTLVVGLAYDNSQGPPTTVEYGKRELVQRKAKANAGTGFSVALWTAPCIRHQNTRDIVATWSASIAARAMFACYVEEAARVDVDSSGEQDATTTPGTGTIETTTVAKTIHIAAFMANGPNSDEAATAGAGHTIGQRIGTAGAPPASNVTLQETHEILTATGDCRGALTLTTERDCAAVICAFKVRQVYTIKKMFQHLGLADHTSDWINVVVEAETPNDTLILHLDTQDFDNLTDEEVRDAIASACAWHALSSAGVIQDPEPDTERDTRLATFIEEQVVL